MAEKLPFMKFFPGDWMKDPSLRAVSTAARGLWIDMLCLMWESHRRGYLCHRNDSPVSPEQLARQTGCSADEVNLLLQELLNCGVCSQSEHGVFISRRLVREERVRQTNQRNGAKGGNPKLLAKSDNRPDNRPPNPPDIRDANRAANPQKSDVRDQISDSEILKPPKAPHGGAVGPPGDPPDQISKPPDPGGSTPPEPSPSSRKRHHYPDAFEAFWAVYPVKSGKDAAVKKWEMAITRVMAQEYTDRPEAIGFLQERVAAFAASPKGRGKFVPHASRWLFEGRYKDDPESWQQSGDSGKRLIEPTAGQVTPGDDDRWG